MFLDALKRQNPRFIECAAELLKSNQVLPDTYIIDVDQFVENARVHIPADHEHRFRFNVNTISGPM